MYNKAAQRRYREKYPEKVKAWGRRGAFLRRLYAGGLTEDEYNEIWNRQGCVCASCGSDKANHRKGWCVDHNHVTGKIRGIICPWCNLLAGHAKDNPRHLRLVA